LFRQDKKSKQLLEGIKDKYGVVIDELIPDILRLGEVQKVLQNLFEEKIPINDLVTILRNISRLMAIQPKEAELLTEHVGNHWIETVSLNSPRWNGTLQSRYDPAKTQKKWLVASIQKIFLLDRFQSFNQIWWRNYLIVLQRP